MGYTHYWYRNIHGNPKNWEKGLKDCRKIIKECQAEYNLVNGMGEENTKPTLRNGISFNGAGAESCETFCLPAHINEVDRWSPDKKMVFDFCKTRARTYDTVVVACLVALKLRLGDDIVISSDGEPLELRAGEELAGKVLGKTVPANLWGTE